MFLAAVSNVPGAAKIALVACEQEKVAKRNSKYKKKGDKYLADRKVDGEFYREMLVQQVFPAIEDKLLDPALPKFIAPVWHQTDNAPPHVAVKTASFRESYAEDGNIMPHPNPQAPRCPESNVLDMSVFNWMQQSVDAAHCITRDDIKKATFAAWEEMPESVILNSFGHLASVHETIVKNKGGNNTNQ